LIAILFFKIKAKTEWHPFTVSSGAEQADIRVNIMKKKNWTKKVYDHFYERLVNHNDTSDLTEVTTDNPAIRNISLPAEITFSGEDEDAIVCIEGPFGTCTSHIFSCEHVVLIGAGIGITPFISALESLIHRLREERRVCFQCGAASFNDKRLASHKLKKVDFIWINRDMENISWFRKILDDFENEQETYLRAIGSNISDQQVRQSRYLDIHLYCTSLPRNDDVMLAHSPYQLVSKMYAVTQQQDMHTQLKTPTHIGRPPMKLLLAKFKAEHQSTDVFFTGNAMLGAEIKRYCDQLGFPFRPESGF
jgi:ferredoxin-NADP reductase